jgi:hypothetical protein
LTEISGNINNNFFPTNKAGRKQRSSNVSLEPHQPCLSICRVELQIRGLTIKLANSSRAKLLHTSLLNITVVAFRVLPLRRYLPMSAPSPPFKTILSSFVKWPSELPSLLLPTSSMSQKGYPFSISFIFGNRKSHWGLDPVSREGVPAQLFVY